MNNENNTALDFFTFYSRDNLETKQSIAKTRMNIYEYKLDRLIWRVIFDLIDDIMKYLMEYVCQKNVARFPDKLTVAKIHAHPRKCSII